MPISAQNLQDKYYDIHNSYNSIVDTYKSNILSIGQAMKDKYNDFQNKYMQCVNGFGSSITINKKNLKFVYSIGLGHILDDKNSDDLVLSYGKCSLF